MTIASPAGRLRQSHRAAGLTVVDAGRLAGGDNLARSGYKLQYRMPGGMMSRETADFREGIAAFLEKRKPLWNK